MVYSTNIKLPGEFFDTPTIKMDPGTFVSKLQKFMEELKPMPSTTVKHQTLFVHKDLRSCSHVFVRIDRVKKALKPPYEGPCVVVERFEKYFTVFVKNKNVIISIDRLKPAYLLVTDKVNNKPIPCEKSDENSYVEDSHLSYDKQTTSRCGSHIKRLVRFQD
ncbi:hypothetical protein AVEN_64592-1 [Araneus ventricosus]|uniref:Uncharacterized protein n=1 Tax=Araneus ventricosus TaxID=182803 RepID=A0A4Y2RVY5_ARAVE|nr:hypothetical protein AVEN_64592-1 [Araneus ventricosus]